jgi:hypothetical protein
VQDDPRKIPQPDAGSPPFKTPVPVTPGSADAPAAKAPADEPVHQHPANPAWAQDLRELYDSVVQEPLPNSFIALLSQLDAED